MKPLLLVDGYNVIGAWREAVERVWPLDECRDRLTAILQDFAGYTAQEVWLVFDGHKAERPQRSVETRAGVTVVYTRQGETADQFIERKCHELPRYREVRVATSDGLEQTLVLGRGATRLSARELWRELSHERGKGKAHQKGARKGRGAIYEALTEEQRDRLERLRRQK